MRPGYTFMDFSRKKLEQLEPTRGFYDHILGKYKNKVRRKLINEDDINIGINVMGATISNKMRQIITKKPVVVVPVLDGAMNFYGKIIYNLTFPIELDTIQIESYGCRTKSSKKITVRKDLTRSLKGRHVLVLEDIVDSGRTMHFLNESIRVQKPASVTIASLLDKAKKRVFDVYIDYVVFRIPNMFVVGCGMDYNNQLRNLPFIGVYEETNKLIKNAYK